MGSWRSILFVCSGNTCRSPMAEILFRDLVAARLGAEAENMRIESAGTGVAQPGSPPNPQAVEAMLKRGLDLSGHQAREVTDAMIEDADLILTMTGSHKADILRRVPHAAGKVFMVKELAAGGSPNGIEPQDIEDPIGATLERYEAVAEEILHALERILPWYYGARGDRRP